MESISTSVGEWKPSCDHSKWCVAKNQNCVRIANVNRTPTQYNRRGALCLDNANIKNSFLSFVRGNEDWNVPVTTDSGNNYLNRTYWRIVPTLHFNISKAKIFNKFCEKKKKKKSHLNICLMSHCTQKSVMFDTQANLQYQILPQSSMIY